MESIVDFKRRVRKLSEPRKHKVRNSLGVYDAYKYYRKNKPKDKQYVLSESQYFSIIRQINNLLAEEIIEGNNVKLPCRMGEIELRKFDRVVTIDTEGKLHSNLPIDWNKTLQLWYEDEEAHKNKTLIRIEEDEMFKIYYNKYNANYNNKWFYEIVFNKDLRVRLKQNIKKGNIDALPLERRVKW